jgi:hypothetical protein
MGGAPVMTSEGRAFPVETRWLPRPPDASCGLRRWWRVGRRRRWRRRGRGAGLPAGRRRNPPGRGSVARPGRSGGAAPVRRDGLCGPARGPGPGGGAQGGAGDLDRRNLADPAGCPGGGGCGPGAAGAVRSELGHVAAGDGTGDAGRGGTAPGPGGARGRRHLLPAVDQGRRRGDWPPFPPPRSRWPTCRPGAGTGALGRTARPAVPDPAPCPGPLAEAQALLQGLGRAG